VECCEQKQEEGGKGGEGHRSGDGVSGKNTRHGQDQTSFGSSADPSFHTSLLHSCNLRSANSKIKIRMHSTALQPYGR